MAKWNQEAEKRGYKEVKKEWPDVAIIERENGRYFLNPEEANTYGNLTNIEPTDMQKFIWSEGFYIGDNLIKSVLKTFICGGYRVAIIEKV